MTEKISALVEYLNNASENIVFSAGFGGSFAPAPITEKKAFVTPRSINGGTIELTVTVYSPAKQGALECVSTAETISRLILSEHCPVAADSVEIGGAKYSDTSMAYSCAVSVTATEDSQARYYFRAYDFTENFGTIISVGIPSYTIVRSFNNSEIRTVFEDLPVGLHDGENVYEITLDGVPRAFVEELAGSGLFGMEVGGESFIKCSCVKSVENETHFATVTVRGYREEIQFGGGVETPWIS